tara:strand:- start:897 stop:1682 length:786 start_codon:yes stop_codon:yes gene_type:complete
MRRGRKIRKVVKITVPAEVSQNNQSNISKGVKRRDNVVKVNPVVQVNRRNTTPNYSAPTNFLPVKDSWVGETAYLIGGGPSLKNFNWSRLNNKKTIAINKAFMFYPQATALYWTDARFYTWYSKDIDNFKGLKYTISARRNLPQNVHLLKRGVKYGVETTKNSLAHGNNSGYAAINLALHLGVKRIVLLGYDMGNSGTTSHFHDGYPVNQTGDHVYDKHFLPGFGILQDQIKGKGIQIFNACPTSKLNTFKKISIEESLSF